MVPQESLRKNLDFAQGNDMTECCEVLNQVLELNGDTKSSSASPDSCEQEWFTPRGVIKVRKLMCFILPIAVQGLATPWHACQIPLYNHMGKADFLYFEP